MIYKAYLTLTYLLIMIPFSVFSQNIAISDQLTKSTDENLKTQLLPALDSLVVQISNNDVSRDLLWANESEFTKAIFEEVYHYESSARDSINVINRTLLNYYPIGKERFLCQLAYFKTTDQEPKTLSMLLTVIAYREGVDISFSTPLGYYTDSWQEKQVGTITYLYRNKLRLDRAEKFAQKNELFSSRFKKTPQTFRFIMVENHQEIMKLIGFDYNAQSISAWRDGYGVVANEFIFSVMNNEDFSHDLFHYYSGTVHERSLRNWVTEEGLAYSWGNAYYTNKDGEMGEQKELLSILKQYLLQHKDTDLLQLFENNFWSDKTGMYEHLAPDYKVGRSISGLICDEVLRKHGMEGINQLITCGTKPNRFDAFFDSTNKLIGLNRKNFNQRVKSLINEIE